MKKLVAGTLAIALVSQNVAFAQSRTDGIGDSAIASAQVQMEMMKSELARVNFELERIENEIAAGSTASNSSNAAALMTSAVAMAGFAAMASASRSKGEGGLVTLVFGGLAAAGGTVASIVLNPTASHFGKKQTLKNEKDAREQIEQTLSAIEEYKRTSSDERGIALADQAEKNMLELLDQVKITTQAERTAQKQRLIVAGVQATAALAFWANQIIGPNQNRTVAFSMATAAGLSSIASLYLGLSDKNKDELLKKIKTTRQQIAVAAVGL